MTPHTNSPRDDSSQSTQALPGSAETPAGCGSSAFYSLDAHTLRENAAKGETDPASSPNITTLRDECSAAEAAYKRAKGAGNTRRAVDRLWRLWTLAKARLAAAGGV